LKRFRVLTKLFLFALEEFKQIKKDTAFKPRVSFFFY